MFAKIPCGYNATRLPTLAFSGSSASGGGGFRDVASGCGVDGAEASLGLC